MKTTPFFYFLSCLFLFLACNNDDDLIGDDRYNIDIGTYSLLDESVAALPYLGRSKIQFVDSLGKTMVMPIIEFDRRISGTVTRYKYDVYETGDTVLYHYQSEGKSFLIRNDSLDISMSFTLTADPDRIDPTTRNVADVVSLWFRETPPGFGSILVFTDILAQRSWTGISNPSININEATIFGRTFSDVLITDFGNFHSEVKFNYEFGILSFTDHSKKTWRFDQFIE